MKNLFLIRLSTTCSVKRLLGLMLFLGLLSPVLYAEDYYVNCGAAPSANANGTKLAPWNTLDPLRAITFAGGDHIYFARGTTLLDYDDIFILRDREVQRLGQSLWMPIHQQTAPLRRFRSSVPWARLQMQCLSWRTNSTGSLNNLDLEGGVQFGLYVANTTAAWLTHLHFSGLVVEGATWVMKQRVDSGEVFIKSFATGGKFNDVLVSHVQAGGASTTVSEGIFVQAGVGYQTIANPTGGNERRSRKLRSA